MLFQSRMLVAGLIVGFAVMLGGCASGSKNEIAAGPDTVSFTVDGMACANCAKHIEEELAEVPGVKRASVNFETKTATVALDPAKPASMEQLHGAVAALKKEHFAAESDPECLDPKRREEIKRGG